MLVSAKYQLLLLYTIQFPLEHSVEIASPAAALLPCDNVRTCETQKQLSPLLTVQNDLKRKQRINPKCVPLQFLFVSLFLILGTSQLPTAVWVYYE